jgi:hypothetical protein
MTIIIPKKLYSQIAGCEYLLQTWYDTYTFDEGNPRHLRVRQITEEYAQFSQVLDNWLRCGGDSWYEQAAQLLANIRCLLRRI